MRHTCVSHLVTLFINRYLQHILPKEDKCMDENEAYLISVRLCAPNARLYFYKCQTILRNIFTILFSFLNVW